MIIIIFSILIIILIIIIGVFYYYSSNNNIIINDIKTKVSSPSILILNTDAKYTSVINNKNDKLLLVYKDFENDYIYYTYLDVNCRIIKNDENYIKLLYTMKEINNPQLFSFNYRLYLKSSINNELRILSLQTKRTYISNINNDVIFFSFNNKYYAIKSLSPLAINELDDSAFIINNEKIILNHIWKKEIELKIITTPIIFNTTMYIIGLDNENNIHLISFNILTFSDIDIANTNIIIDDNNNPSGFIYNNLTKQFYICTITDNKKIKIIKYIH